MAVVSRGTRGTCTVDPALTLHYCCPHSGPSNDFLRRGTSAVIRQTTNPRQRGRRCRHPERAAALARRATTPCASTSTRERRRPRPSARRRGDRPLDRHRPDRVLPRGAFASRWRRRAVGPARSPRPSARRELPLPLLQLPQARGAARAPAEERAAATRLGRRHRSAAEPGGRGARGTHLRLESELVDSRKDRERLDAIERALRRR